MRDFKYFFKTAPTVFLTGEYYQIMVPVEKSSLMYISVGNEKYYDESNGILRSDVPIHRVNIPKYELDALGKYEIVVREMIERKPYFSNVDEEYSFEFQFYTAKSESIILYHIADSHNHILEAIAACKQYESLNGRINLLIINGDITDYTHKIEDYNNIYQLTGEITKGQIPVIFSRGNHDTRGIMAEKMENYTPTYKGRSYYSFRFGDLWGLVLDCGEDKDDLHEEYANTICCHEFRKRQTRYIEQVIKNSKTEYEAPGVKKRIVISHIPFMKKRTYPFNIEEDLYEEWSNYLKEYIQPNLAICGHEHELSFEIPDDKNKYPCPVVVGTKPITSSENEQEIIYIGTGISFIENKISITCNDNQSNVVLYRELMI